MSCFAMRTTSSSRSRGVKIKSWRWWRKCAGLAAAAHSRLRRSVMLVRWSSAPGLGGRRRHAPPLPSAQREWRGHHRSFAPVYVDELYSQQPKSLSVVHEEEKEPPCTSKLARAAAAAGTAGDTTRASSGNIKLARVAAAGTATTATRASGGNKARVAAAATTGGNKARAVAAAARSVLLSPMRGGGVAMGEVDLKAELFIRKFREEMRLQSQRSAEELQAMLARGL